LYGSNALLIIAYVANFLPHGVRTANAGFHQVSREMDESAAICGSPWLTTFRRITLPLVAPSLAGGWIFLFILMSREVSASVMVASPGTPVISLVVLDLWGNGHVPRLAAYSIGVLVLSTVFTLVAIRLGATGGARS